MIDITITRACATCQTETNLRYHDGLTTFSERSTLDCRIDPDEFLLCPTCGNPQRLHIQAQPYALVNHRFESPVHNALYEQQLKEEKNTA